MAPVVICMQRHDSGLAVSLQVQTQLANHVAAVLPAILVGLACGVLGTIFTVLNVKVVRLRDAVIQVHSASSVLPYSGLCSGFA